MDALKVASATIALLMTIVPVQADDIERWRPLIADASARFQVPTDWIERVIAIESRGQTMLDGRPITSRAGAMGLMQLMPQTWAAMRSRLGLGGNPHDPKDNILAGTLYLRLMYDRFGYPGLFGAYNAGPGRYAAALGGLRVLPAETRNYLRRTAGGDPPMATTRNASSPKSLPGRTSSVPPLLIPRGQPLSIFVSLGQAATP